MKKKPSMKSNRSALAPNELWFRLKPVVTIDNQPADFSRGWLSHVTGKNVFVEGYVLR